MSSDYPESKSLLKARLSKGIITPKHMIATETTDKRKDELNDDYDDERKSKKKRIYAPRRSFIHDKVENVLSNVYNKLANGEEMANLKQSVINAFADSDKSKIMSSLNNIINSSKPHTIKLSSDEELDLHNDIQNKTVDELQQIKLQYDVDANNVSLELQKLKNYIAIVENVIHDRKSLSQTAKDVKKMLLLHEIESISDEL
jgi:hypothetical protein